VAEKLGEFVLATTNPNKAREVRAILAASGLDLELLERPAEVPEVEETEPTLLGNARLKAWAVVEATGKAAIAEDSGIEVEALGGAPGARSARYAGEPPDDQANVDKLLAELRAMGRHGPAERRARFVTVAVAAWPGGQEVVAEGSVEGWVAESRRGSGGFGYDPVFVPSEGDGRTFGEIEEATPGAKHELSHRGRALRALAGQLAAAGVAGQLAAAGDGSGAITSGVPRAGRAPKRHRHWWPRTARHLAELLLAGFLIEYFVVPNIGGTHKELHVLASANPLLPLAGLGCEVLSLVAYFQLTRSLLPKRSDPGFATVSRIELSTLALSHVVPGGNAVGYSLGYGLLMRAGVPGADAGVALAAQGLGSAVVLNAIFWLALLASLPLYGFQVAYLLAAIVGLVLMTAVGALVVLFTRGNEGATRLLRTIGARLPFMHHETLPRLFSRLVERLGELAKDRRQLARALSFAAANWLFDAASLFFFVAAFGRWEDPIALLVAYGLANILAVIPVTPAGLGIVEGSVIPILVGFGAPRSIASLGVLGWRLVNFWLPIPVGGLSYLSLRAHPPAEDQAGLAARRAVWQARWRWVVQLFAPETPAPEPAPAIDESLSIIEEVAEMAGALGTEGEAGRGQLKSRPGSGNGSQGAEAPPARLGETAGTP
jgi:non-canonical purine NTP pyrophosphatase (RdgB/HAM1 family)